jgi:hypothetical protein
VVDRPGVLIDHGRPVDHGRLAVQASRFASAVAENRHCPNTAVLVMIAEVCLQYLLTSFRDHDNRAGDRGPTMVGSCQPR